MTETPPVTPPVINVSKEIIWHMSCGQCGYYWTVPTMREEEDPTRRAWTCPLCATKSTAERADYLR